MSKTYSAAAIAVMIAVSSAAHGQIAPKGPEPGTYINRILFKLA